MIPFLDLTRQHAALKDELMAATGRVLDSARFILGGEGEALERELAARAGHGDDGHGHEAHGVQVGPPRPSHRLRRRARGRRPRPTASRASRAP